MLSQHSCPKCNGKLYIDSDLHGWYVQCLMCGFFHDLEELDISQNKDSEIELQLSQSKASDLQPDSRAKYA